MMAFSFFKFALVLLFFFQENLYSTAAAHKVSPTGWLMLYLAPQVVVKLRVHNQDNTSKASFPEQTCQVVPRILYSQLEGLSPLSVWTIAKKIRPAVRLIL